MADILDSLPADQRRALIRGHFLGIAQLASLWTVDLDATIGAIYQRLREIERLIPARGGAYSVETEPHPTQPLAVKTVRKCVYCGGVLLDGPHDHTDDTVPDVYDGDRPRGDY